MAYTRPKIAIPEVSSEELTRILIGIGFRFAGSGVANQDIEQALMLASIEAEKRRGRVRSMLFAWFNLHGEFINVDRLYQFLSVVNNRRVIALWATLAAWRKNDSRYRRIRELYKGRRIHLLEKEESRARIELEGEDRRFLRGALIVPNGLGLGDEVAKIYSREELAAGHIGYRNRVLMGASYRADLVTELMLAPNSNPAALADKTYASYKTAWYAKRDFEVYSAAEGG